jgi:iron complex outermembrane recepter protein
MSGNKIRKIIFILLFFPASVFASQEIPQVVVGSNYSTEQSQSTIDTTAPVKVINNEQIKAMGAQSVEQVLQSFAGVQVTDMYGDGSRVSVGMRGFGDNAASNTLILLNGQPLNNPDMKQSDFNFIPVSQIKQIEIMPGSAGVLYGDQAVGGVINIITKAPGKEERNAAISYGSYATRNLQATLGNTFKNGFSYKAFASYYQSNGYRQHNDNRVNNLGLQLNYKYKTGKLYFNYQKINQHLQLPGNLTEEQVRQDRRQAENKIDYNNEDTDFFQAGFWQNISDNWQLKLDSTLRNMSGYGEYYMGDNTPIYAFNESRTVSSIDPKVTGVFNVGKYSIFPTIGGEFIQGDYNYGGTDSAMKQYSYYGRFNIPLGKKFTFIMGARQALAAYDLNEQQADDKAMATDLELSWQFNKNLRFFIRRADSYRFPKVDENTWTLDNKLLNTQEGVSYESGIKFTQKRYNVLLNIYRLDLTNEIAFIPIKTSDYYGYNVNLDPTTRSGVSLSGQYFITDDWSLNAGGDLVNAKFKSGDYKGNRIPFVAAEMFHLATAYSFHSHWRFYLEDIFNGNRYPSNDDPNITELLGGYSIYNFNIQYTRKNYSLNLRLNNLTNKYYYSYAVATSSGTDAMSTSYYPAAGFNAMLNFAVNL